MPTRLTSHISIDPQLIYDFGLCFLKEAASPPQLSYSLAGRLYLSKSGWLLLHVPNALVRGAFDAMDEPGIELPNDGDVNAHISVMTKEEVDEIGPDKITERGHSFRYTLGRVKSVNPFGQSEFSKVWFVQVSSPELKKLRKSYGLPALPYGDHEFHITLAYRRKKVLQNSDISKVAEDEDAKGIPDRRYYGNPGKIKPGLLDFVIQRHLAERAGPHFDFRFGDPTGLHSFATRRTLPGPGGRIALFQQPMHSYKYKDWEGTIPSGQYGAGRVKQHRAGQLLFTKISPDAIHFTTADKKHPERFVLVKPKTWKEHDWLLINKTPTSPLPYNKVRYKKIPAEQVDSFIDKMQKGDSLEAKVDGASSLIKLLKDGVELTSYRRSSETGRPIVHTERFFHGLPTLDIPEGLVGSVLKGEIYGLRSGDGEGSIRGGVDQKGSGEQRPGHVLSPQELGGILNSTLAKSITDQQEKQIRLRNMVYDLQSYGGKEIGAETPRAERRRMIEEILQHLPKDKFHISEEATDPATAKALWEKIRSGQHGLTGEGVVMWPHTGTPMKGKLTEDVDVHITGTFPGAGRLSEGMAGGLEYSLQPGGPVAGRIGTGFSDELRRELGRNPDAYKGRVARIRSQEQLPSGAYRAPSFIAFHEDYPSAKVASVLEDGASQAAGTSFLEMVELGIVKSAEPLERESEGRKTRRFYHTTTPAALQSIIEHGLSPTFAGSGADRGVPTDVPGYKQQVYLSATPAGANYPGGVMLTIDLPEEFALNKVWTLPFTSRVWASEKPIPPDYITFPEKVEGTKQARFFLGEALNQRLNTPFTASGNPLKDMAGYLTSIPRMANERIRLAHGADRIKGLYDPQYRYEQTLRMLEGQPDELVTNPYDKLIQAFPAFKV